MTYIKFDYWKFAEELRPEYCKKIIDLAENKWIRGAILDEKNHKNHRVAWTYFTNEQWIYDIVFEYMRKANEYADWNFQIDASEALQITKYDTNGYQNYHYDGDDDYDDSYDDGPNAAGDVDDILWGRKGKGKGKGKGSNRWG